MGYEPEGNYVTSSRRYDDGGPQSQHQQQNHPLSSSPRSSCEWCGRATFVDYMSSPRSAPAETELTSLYSPPPPLKDDDASATGPPSSSARKPRQQRALSPIVDGEEGAPGVTTARTDDDDADDNVPAGAPSDLLYIGGVFGRSSAKHDAGFREKEQNAADQDGDRRAVETTADARPFVDARRPAPGHNASAIAREPEAFTLPEREPEPRERRLTLSGGQFPDETRRNHRKITRVFDVVESELGCPQKDQAELPESQAPPGHRPDGGSRDEPQQPLPSGPPRQPEHPEEPREGGGG